MERWLSRSKPAERLGSGFAGETATEHKRFSLPKTSLEKESFSAEICEGELYFTAWQYSFLPVTGNEASWQPLLREEQPVALVVLCHRTVTPSHRVPEAALSPRDPSPECPSLYPLNVRSPHPGAPLL